jgi:hypothetical protein
VRSGTARQGRRESSRASKVRRRINYGVGGAGAGAGAGVNVRLGRRGGTEMMEKPRSGEEIGNFTAYKLGLLVHGHRTPG